MLVPCVVAIPPRMPLGDQPLVEVFAIQIHRGHLAAIVVGIHDDDVQPLPGDPFCQRPGGLFPVLLFALRGINAVQSQAMLVVAGIQQRQRIAIRHAHHTAGEVEARGWGIAPFGNAFQLPGGDLGSAAAVAVRERRQQSLVPVHLALLIQLPQGQTQQDDADAQELAAGTFHRGGILIRGQLPPPGQRTAHCSRKSGRFRNGAPGRHRDPSIPRGIHR